MPSKGAWKFEPQDTYVEMAKLQGRKLLPGEGYFRDNNGDWIIASESGRIASVTFKGKAKRGDAWKAPDPEGFAHALLISKSPQMAEALRTLVDEWNGSKSTWRMNEFIYAAECLLSELEVKL